MNPLPDEKLESSLRSLTWWEGPAPEAWKKALASAPRAPGQRAILLQRVLRSRWPWIGLPVAAMIVAAIWLAPEERTLQVLCKPPAVPSAPNWGWSRGDAAEQLHVPITAGRPEQAFTEAGDKLEKEAPVSLGYAYSKGGGGSNSAPAAPAADERHVIQKAAIDLESDDVRGLYVKIQKLLPVEAEGEYAEQAQIFGTGKDLQAYLTLRVQAARLGQVLDRLRQMADVLKEQTESTDVTSQVVDIEARLRNERRVEKGLLDLLDSRKDAPLQDVLKVSESLANVRERIEKLTADQQRIGRQVALASIVISIRPKPVAAPTPAGLVSELKSRLSGAWTGGLYFLIGSVAALTQVLIGGLIWWVLLVLLLWWVRRWYLRRTATAHAQ